MQQRRWSLRGSLGDYSELDVTEVDGGADLSFTYVDQTRLQVLNRMLVGEDGRSTSLYWQTRASDWEQARPVFDEIAGTFRPAG